jgi:hypothetical protein
MKRVVLTLLAGAMLMLTAGASQAALSRNNPYRSFNSGINYGAQLWERSHHHMHHVGLLRRL